MKKQNKIVIVATLILLTICVVNFISNPENRIKNFIKQNNEELVIIAKSYLNSDMTIKSYKGVEVEQVFNGKMILYNFITVEWEFLPPLNIMDSIIHQMTNQ